MFLDMLYTICTYGQEGAQTAATSEAPNVSSQSVDFIASLLMELVCPDVVPSVMEWIDEESVKAMIEKYVACFLSCLGFLVALFPFALCVLFS